MIKTNEKIHSNKYKVIEEDELESYILETLEECLKDSSTSVEGKYHHNAKFVDAPSIIKNGILSIKELVNRGIISLSKEQLDSLENEESHVNGIDGISLAVMGLDDISPKEDIYNPFLDDAVDFIISDKISTRRHSRHYGNEFVSYKSIDQADIQSVDIRIIKLMKRYIKSNKKYKLVKIYNYLIDLAKAIEYEKLDLCLREMSKDGEEKDLDTYMLSKSNKILLTKTKSVL